MAESRLPSSLSIKAAYQARVQGGAGGSKAAARSRAWAASSRRPSRYRTRARFSAPSASTQVFHLGEGRFGLSRLALLALSQQADAVVVPALPVGDAARCGYRGLLAGQRQGDAVCSQGGDGQVVARETLPHDVAVKAGVELAVLERRLHSDRALPHPAGRVSA